MEAKSTLKPDEKPAEKTDEKLDEKLDEKPDEKPVKKPRKLWRVLDKLRPRYKSWKESGYAFIARPIPPNGRGVSSNNPFDAIAFVAYK